MRHPPDSIKSHDWPPQDCKPGRGHSSLPAPDAKLKNVPLDEADEPLEEPLEVVVVVDEVELDVPPLVEEAELDEVEELETDEPAA